MLENMTTGEKALIGATAIGIAALVFHKPTRNAVGLSDRVKAKGKKTTWTVVYNPKTKPNITNTFTTVRKFNNPQEAIEEVIKVGGKNQKQLLNWSKAEIDKHKEDSRKNMLAFPGEITDLPPRILKNIGKTEILKNRKLAALRNYPVDIDKGIKFY
jgi:hypothetical protein